MKASQFITVMAGLLLGAAEAMVAGEPLLKQSDVFLRGQDGVNIYRIPGVIVSPAGTVLAFCEGREGDDQSPTDLVLKRSFDNGATWGKMQIVVKRQGPQAIMNPCPVIDRKDGAILLFCNLFPDGKSQDIPGAVKQLVLRSTDDGATWSRPEDISSQIGDPKKWASLCSGPGVAIQTSSGRIVVPLWHHEGGGESDYLTGAFFSDDHGKTWRAGKAVAGGGDEGQVVELADGTLMLNWRWSKMGGKTQRCWVAVSKDGGDTWSKPQPDDSLISPICQASILRYTKKGEGHTRNRLLFSNPATTSKRENMTVRISYDEGKTWPVGKTVCAGPSAYSCLAVLKDGTIGVLYETGEKDAYEKIRFARFNVEWLSDGADRLPR